jgi:hypothetical protein
MAIREMLRAVPLLFLTAALPALTQNPQDRSQQPNTRPSPGGQQGRPGGPPGNNRPPGNQNPGRPVTKPSPGNRPPGNQNPGNRPPARPNPGNKPPGRPVSGTRPPSNRPPQWGRPPQNRPSYHFRPTDNAYLRRYYRNRLISINRARRPIFTIGGFFPFGDIQYLSALPPDVYGYLPPPPPGYQMGYFDGYVVVYDPLTYFIANVIDLLQ